MKPSINESADGSEYELDAFQQGFVFWERLKVEVGQADVQDKRPLGESENALPVQIVSAFVTDLLLRALDKFSKVRGFGHLYLVDVNII